MGVPKRQWWTPEEDRILRRTFPTRGATVTTASLAQHGYPRSRNAVRSRAQKHSIVYRPEGSIGLIPLSEVHPDPRRQGSADKHAVTRAYADGVVTKARLYPHQLLVPPDWADRYLEGRVAFEDRMREAVRTWYTAEQTAKLFEVVPSSLHTAWNKRPGNSWALTEHLHRIETVYSKGLTILGKRRYHRYWKPEDVHREAALYRNRPHYAIQGRRAA